MTKRILIKLSGEALLQQNDNSTRKKQNIAQIIDNIIKIIQNNIETIIVIGGGNIFRGVNSKEKGINRVDGDYIGMLATVINAIAIKSMFEKKNQKTEILSTILINPITCIYSPYNVEKCLQDKKIVICAAGTGNTLLSTDTSAVIRAVENQCDVMLKVTKVDGVYDQDPVKNPNAKRYDKITYQTAIGQKLKFIDTTAMIIAQEHKMTIKVLAMKPAKNIFEVANGNGFYTEIQ